MKIELTRHFISSKNNRCHLEAHLCEDSKQKKTLPSFIEKNWGRATWISERGWSSDTEKKKHGVINHNHYMENREWLLSLETDRCFFYLFLFRCVFITIEANYSSFWCMHVDHKS